jgi:HEPN domain-containing protein
MEDMEPQVQHWRRGAEEDMDVARDLIARRRVRHGLFFMHLALEKALKAIVCRVTKATPPRIHNLVRLAELAEVKPTPIQLASLAKMTTFCLEGRYPGFIGPAPTADETRRYVADAEEVFRWLTKL